MDRKHGSWESMVLGGKYGPYDIWSPLVSASGSALYTRYVNKLTKSRWSDSWRNKRNCWDRRILLTPHGEPETRFIVGFVAFFGDTYLCQVNTKHERLVGEGPYVMLFGPMPCCAFTLSAGRSMTITLDGVSEGETLQWQWRNFDLY